MRFRFDNALFALALASFPGAVQADDWVATKLRGAVYTLQNGQWAPLRREDVVSDSRPIRTGPDGAAQFTRDAETVDMGPDTQIRIFDHAGQRFTTVNESFGEVSIEANVRNVRHFAVQTPFIAAVVKGTIFAVTSSQTNSRVDVTRGRVGVEDFSTQTSVDVLANQHASAGAGRGLNVAGVGRLQPVRDKNGAIVVNPGVTMGDDAVTALPATAPASAHSSASTLAANPPPAAAATPTPTPPPSPSPSPSPSPAPAPSPSPSPSPPGSTDPNGKGHHWGWGDGRGHRG